MDPDEGCGGARDENPDLVKEVVEGVKLAICGERRGCEREEERWGDALVDGVFGNIYQEEGKHVGYE